MRQRRLYFKKRGKFATAVFAFRKMPEYVVTEVLVERTTFVLKIRAIMVSGKPFLPFLE